MCPEMKAVVEDFYQYDQEESLRLQLYFGKYIDRQADSAIVCSVPPDIAQVLALPVQYFVGQDVAHRQSSALSLPAQY